jgi:PhzF family phenazine biosynthesis protein
VYPRSPDAGFRQTADSRGNELSETSFVCRETDRYRIQYFTPAQEVQLCGHATLAAAHCIWSEHIDSDARLRFKANRETIPVERESGWIKMGFPLDTLSDGILPIDLKPAIGFSEGVRKIRKSAVGWYLIEVEDETLVLKACPDFNALIESNTMILITSGSSDKRFDFVSRFFAPSVGINEDPVTGYAHITLGKFWSEKTGKTELVGRQLSRRQGVVRVRLEKERTQLLGQAVTVFEIRPRETPAGDD